MDKAKITVQLTQRQPTPSVQHPISKSTRAIADEINIPTVQQTERVYPIYQKQGTIDVESPYLDEWYSWLSDESQDVHVGTQPPRQSKLVWLKLFISASGAIVTGLLIGFLMMKLFQHETQEIIVHTTPIDYPTNTYTLLQHGVFQSVDSARKAQQTLQNKGFPSALVSGDKHTVYVGFAMRQEDAQVLRYQLKAEQFDVFLKKIEVPACVEACTDPKIGKTWLTVMEQSNRAIKLIHDLSISYLTSPDTKPLDAQSLQPLHQALTAWHNMKSSLEKELSVAAYSQVVPLLNPLEQAMSSLLTANQTPTRVFMGTIQKDTMQAIFAQKQLLESLP